MRRSTVALLLVTRIPGILAIMLSHMSSTLSSTDRLIVSTFVLVIHVILIGNFLLTLIYVCADLYGTGTAYVACLSLMMTTQLFARSWFESVTLANRACGGGIAAWRGTSQTDAPGNRFGAYIFNSRIIRVCNLSIAIGFFTFPFFFA